MGHIEKLKKYLDSKLIQYTIEEDLITLDNWSYNLVGEDEKIFDEDMNFLPTSDNDVDLIYSFAGRWYTNMQGNALTLDELIYKGVAKSKLPTNSFLGIRSGFELGNGLGNYSSYIKKAKFLGVS